MPLLPLVAVLLGAMPPAAHAIEVLCGASGEGDAFGWSMATGGDFDGDGIDDLAVGAPCGWTDAAAKAGYVAVYSGATQRRILLLRSSEAGEKYGAAVAFLGDLDGDGKSELAVGASGHDAPKPAGGLRADAGRVEVRSSDAGASVLWQLEGANESANVGESLARLPDLDGDSRDEVLVGGSGIQVAGTRGGSALLRSGATGAELTRDDASSPGQYWASLVGDAGDVDADGVPDWMASSNFASVSVEIPTGGDAVPAIATTTTMPTPLLEQAGHLRILSGKSPFGVLTELRGQYAKQRFGRSMAVAGDADGDGGDDLWIGSPGWVDGPRTDAGCIALHSGLGLRIRRILEPVPQLGAAFGTSVAVPGSLDGGSRADVAAGAPLAQVGSLVQAGRVHAFDATTGTPLWTLSGSVAGERFGNALLAAGDVDGDGVGDLLVGAPGAAPAGRRGAGAVSVVSGKTGTVLRIFRGRRGRETRIFVGGTGLGRQLVLRGMDPFGHRREQDVQPFRGQGATAPSMALLDVSTRAGASGTLLAVGSGPGGGAPNVAVYRAGRRPQPVSAFTGGPDGYAGGVSVATGDFSSQTGQELAVVPADAVAGATSIVVYRRAFTDPYGRITWSKVRDFQAFGTNDSIDGAQVKAVGAGIVGGPLTSSKELDELVAAPLAGLPALRVLSNTGATVSQWQAYPVGTPSGGQNSGLSVALGDLHGNGTLSLVTAPAKGQPWVRAWRYDGAPLPNVEGGSTPTSFFATQYGGQYEGGLRVTTADVDFDGADEILVAPASGGDGKVLAFELDGKVVAGWATTAPLGPIARSGLTLAGFNDFWRP